ncbi:GNAT family N-acetyltransferase [Aminipila terrae]|uniref:GNAT family N-acetyltransferase n=1 Tax=Aminipila terrae TaxID=2697030 RepID=A0A6P1MMN1_9FIRM|nr:GNAT family N-acetyltransferase [Aminipila terrae]
METSLPDFIIRFAEKPDAPLIVKYIRDLASYENELEDVTVTPETLEKYMFDQKGAECLIGEFNGNPVGFAFFHNSFSTFLGKPGINLVDLYIEPDMRGRGYGKAMLSYLAKLTKERDCGRLEWWVHDWNESAAKHYLNWGAEMVKYIRVYRMDGQPLDKFSKEFK